MPKDAAKPTELKSPPKDTPWQTWVAVAMVSCRIEANGHPSNCTLRDLKGDASFGEPAVQYARSLVYRPGFDTGAGPVIPDHQSLIGFRAASKLFPSEQRAAPGFVPKVNYPAEIRDGSTANVRLACDVQLDGTPANCSVLANTGAASFAREALLATKALHYEPAWANGQAVREDHRVISIWFSPPILFPENPTSDQGLVPGPRTMSVRLEYPSKAAENGRDGGALIYCDLGADGVNRNCAVAAVQGDAAFGPAALTFVQGETQQMTRNGVPVAVPHHSYIIRFVLDRNRW